MRVAVCLPHSSQEEVQDTLLPHGDAGGVGEVYQSLHHLRADVTQRHLRGAALSEAAGEHGSEVGAARGQHHFVHLDTRRHGTAFSTHRQSRRSHKRPKKN